MQTDLKAEIMRITNAVYPGAYKETTVNDPTTGHAPLPWRVGSEYPATVFTTDARTAGRLVCQCDPHDKFHPSSIANAALIVRAVNAHQALVEALTELMEGMSACMSRRTERAGWSNMNGEDCECWACNAARQTEAALNLARGEA